MPILVGGTHYYIQSVIWDSLIEQNQDDKDKDSNKRKLPINDNSIIILIFRIIRLNLYLLFFTKNQKLLT
jgi:tRNA A37 N6-isopentenylltransferase MiaA